MAAVEKVLSLSISHPAASLRPSKGHLRGKAVTGDGNPIDGCAIIIQETGRRTQSDKNGDFTIINIEPASYTLLAKRPGYDSGALPNVRIKAGDNPGFRIIMRPITPIGG